MGLSDFFSEVVSSLGFAEAQAEAPAQEPETTQDESSDKTEASESTESESAEETPAEESSEEAPEEEEPEAEAEEEEEEEEEEEDEEPEDIKPKLEEGEWPYCHFLVLFFDTLPMSIALRSRAMGNWSYPFVLCVRISPCIVKRQWHCNHV
jgi:TATA-binding protein-associated factor Taf7